ncbi:ribosomal protein subunit S26 [Schizosaccharomyces japonicus yFS275]|uniref:Ribosomal protein subunit S26 n=1 Tax=Schizosaccharomyces japonicus (strain yFS275 / FY16936) TaxID=402676 RepID=B6JYR7_SCHJY|nr:ribosomal protein subunit S26 [Schizosaccharomyces japonicus yFS275]EEB06685.1 ribosomal protein subunit S26 [Schizosaccharomyces japonicus yFS275]
MKVYQRFKSAIPLGYKNFLSSRALRVIDDYHVHLRGILDRYCDENNLELRNPLFLMQNTVGDASKSKIFSCASQMYNNRRFFATIKAPEVTGTPSNYASEASPALQEDINYSFGSIDMLRDQFLRAGTAVFGDAWLWLVYEQRTHFFSLLFSYNTSSAVSWGANDWFSQPKLGTSITPIMCVNLWQYAYLTDYGLTKKHEYLRRWWDAIDWKEVNAFFQEANQ